MSCFWDKIRRALMRLRDHWTRFTSLPEDGDVPPSMGFFRAWLISRDHRDLLYSVPTLLACCLLAMAAHLAASPHETDSADTYLELAEAIRSEGIRVATGEFQAMMKVSLINDGPVTVVVDSNKSFY